MSDHICTIEDPAMPFLRLSMLSFDMVISSLPFFPGSNRLEVKEKITEMLGIESRKMWRCLGGPRIQDSEWQCNLHLYLFSHLPLPHGVKLLLFFAGWTDGRWFCSLRFRSGAGFQGVKRGDETFRSAYQRHAEVRRTSSGPWTLRHLIFINFCPQKGGDYKP